MGEIELQIDTRSMIERDVYLYGEYESITFARLRRLLRDGKIRNDIFVDIGANIGIYSLRVSRLFSRIVAFEPNPAICARLRDNITLNGYANITVFADAIGATAEELWFCVPTEDNENHGVAGFSECYMQRAGIQYAKVTVSVRPLDTVLALDLSRVSVIKLDVEGFELPALRGMEKIVKASRPLIIIEVTEEAQGRMGHTSQDVFAWFHQHNYALHDERTFEVVTKPTTANLFGLPVECQGDL